MLVLTVGEREITTTEKAEFVRGTVGATCKIIFDEFWQGYNKTVVFKRTNECVSSYGIFVGGMETETTIPHEILRESGTFQIGVFGTTESSTLPTLWSDEISILYGTDTDTTFPEEPTPSIYSQLVALSTKAVEVANSVREDADNGEFNGEKGDKGDKGDDYVLTLADKTEIADLVLSNFVDVAVVGQ